MSPNTLSGPPKSAFGRAITQLLLLDKVNAKDEGLIQSLDDVELMFQISSLSFEGDAELSSDIQTGPIGCLESF